MEIKVKKILLFSCFCIFLVFNHDFLKHIEFTRIVASNAATDDISN